MIYQQQCASSSFATSLRTMTKLFCAAILGATILAQAQTYTILHTFTGQGDGSTPIAGLTIDRAGNLYGTTSGLIDEENGTVFKLTRAGSGWILSTLYTFQGDPDGATPQAQVVFGPDGSLYGTTTYGGLGDGTVFNLRPPATACHAVQCPWTETVLYRFTGGSDGAHPQYGDLAFDADGNIYGTTSNSDNRCGVVFKLSRSGGGWTESVLYSFGGASGCNPYSGVIFDSAGNLYGTTLSTVYELSPSGSGWTETTLHTFEGQDDGTEAYGGLIFDQQGNLYGTTFNDGQDNAGTVYELQPSGGNWTETVLRYVEPGPTDTPTLDGAGNLYATLGGDGPSFGEVFRLTRGSNGWTYRDLFDFSGGQFTDGFTPFGGAVLDTSGNLYGTTSQGGDENCGEGCGVVWEITP
jgi:uncharacterized repeat protein (TIGR03803 family)